MLLLVVYYIFYFDPELDPFRPKWEKNKKAEHPNPVDVIVVRQIRKLRRLLGLRTLPADDASPENSERILRYEATLNKVRQVPSIQSSPASDIEH